MAIRIDCQPKPAWMQAVSAATSTSSTPTMATTPKGPMSLCFMIRSMVSRSRRLPSASAKSASPSRCNAPDSPATTSTPSTAASRSASGCTT